MWPELELSALHTYIHTYLYTNIAYIFCICALVFLTTDRKVAKKVCYDYSPRMWVYNNGGVKA